MQEQVHIYLDVDLHRDLKIKSAVEGRSMGKVVREAVRQYVYGQSLQSQGNKESNEKTNRQHTS